MMMNLFSTFDPCTGTLSLNWLSSIMFMMLMNYNYWMNMNNSTIMTMKIINTMKSELMAISNYKKSCLMFLSMGMLILINNMMGLLPYIFTASSHLVFSLSLSLPMWLSFFTYGWIKTPNSMFIHMVPLGTPKLLMPFMVLIETISNLIRPGSLSVRLTANMIAGHLLMSLLGTNCSMGMTIMFMLIFMTLMLFETAVSMIQSYVLMVLTTLYSSEV
uniref:ATP synthase subunit a n=1 Tax=Leptocentrus longispinus TaxID=3065210 RepID=A0AA95SU48_9HEMI|nr:ATP synthase F0 subunit 6 [Leptocentrus longispinus]WKZ08075.1 ATP synthase F0 subunit 6 [Leptocentrus longispinus]